MRDTRFTFLCNREERELLTALARRLARTESDVVRQLILAAARQFNVVARPPEPANDSEGDESSEAQQNNVG
jgi:hypothetical protein